MHTLYTNEELPHANGRKHVVNEQGMTYHNYEYDVVIERIPEVEMLMQQRCKEVSMSLRFN